MTLRLSWSGSLVEQRQRDREERRDGFARMALSRTLM
jgi:hypothetical protein